ncbi:hypothetical protein J2S89_002913 [Arthrobacter bambusae]|nr:hypothetical protein [Arthrobacter bambusae]MDQ0098798.1 hypothetical protein [Arthrobacter bambusae]
MTPAAFAQWEAALAQRTELCVDIAGRPGATLTVYAGPDDRGAGRWRVNSVDSLAVVGQAEDEHAALRLHPIQHDADFAEVHLGLSARSSMSLARILRAVWRCFRGAVVSSTNIASIAGLKASSRGRTAPESSAPAGPGNSMPFARSVAPHDVCGQVPGLRRPRLGHPFESARTTPPLTPSRPSRRRSQQWMGSTLTGGYHSSVISSGMSGWWVPFGPA